MVDLATYEAPGHPIVSVLRDGELMLAALATLTLADSDTETVSKSISGLAPKRPVTEEEEAFGVTGFDPPSAQTTLGEQRLIDALVRATHAAIESTLGSLSPGSAAVIAAKLGHSVRSAIAKLPASTAPEGIGTVYVPPAA